MLRKRQSLDGKWQFVLDTESQFSFSDIIQHHEWRTIEVPMPWQAQFDDLRLSVGTGWYRLSFHVPGDWADGATVLHFGAAFYHAQVWLNGEYIGEDENGYLPFEFLIQSHLQFGAENELVVRATTPSEDPDRYPDYPFSEILHGKQSWYGHWGGLWQPVWIEARALTHIQQVQIFPDAEAQTLECAVSLRNSDSQPLQATLLAPDESVVAHTSTEIHNGHIRIAFTLDAPPLRWSPDTPHLYRLRLALGNGDIVEKTCGFRTIEARAGQLLLNGEPFYMRGALDQDYYPDTLSTPPSVEFLEDQLLKAKAMGLNTIRYHIKFADPRYYEVADRLGMLLWVDLPNWQHLTERVKQRIWLTFERMLQRDGHHPAIAIWTIVNEDWGTDLVHNGDHRAWVRESFDWLKSKDPTRLIVDNSACLPNFHLKSDIEDYHFYRAIPEHTGEWDEIIAQFAGRADFAYSPNDDIERTYEEPLIVSEFGNWGLPHPDKLKDDNGSEPWWFETGHDWGEGIVYPHGIEHRFHQWHLERFFGNFDRLIEAVQWQQYAALKYEIESMRLHPAIQGYIITELTDAHWEGNGLLDMRRNPRIFHERLAQLNADVIVIPRPQRYAYLSGDEVSIQLTLASTKTAAIRAIRWQIDGATEDHSIAVHANSVEKTLPVDDLVFTAPEVVKPVALTIHLQALDDNNTVLHHTHVEILVLPGMGPSRTIITDSDNLGERLTALGYTIHPSSSFWITDHVSPAFQEHIWKGGDGLMVAGTRSGLPTYQSGGMIQQQFPYLGISPREGTIWQGDWVSSFSWLHPDLISLDLAESPLMGLPFQAILPDAVLTGCTQEDFQHAILGGMFVGWVHRPVATLLKKRFGQGHLAVTTLKLIEPAVADDPLARYVLRVLYGTSTGS